MTVPFYDESAINTPNRRVFLLSCYTLKHPLTKEKKKWKEEKQKLTKNHILYDVIYMKCTNRNDC